MILNRKIRDTLVLNSDMNPLSMLPPTTVKWELAVKAVYGGHAQVVHEYKDWEVHSPSTTIRVPSVIMVNDYVHYQKVIPWNEQYLFLRDSYTCQYCLKKFGTQYLTQDHVKPRKVGGKTNYENIVSACGPCNHKRGHNEKIRPAIVPYKPSYWELVEKIRQLDLTVPDETWTPYLQWPEEKLFVMGQEKKILQLRRAA